ncbi:hypothetical protein EBS80_02255 [bacterium]|nr:hypothetical protein [bacterium]
MSKKFLGYVLGGVMALALALPALHGVPAHAQALTNDEFFGGEITGSDFAANAGLSAGDLPTTIASLIRVVLGFLGIVAVVIILIGGFKWMTAGGNDDKVKSARKVMVSGIIGLVIVLSAFAIAQFVLSSIITATTSA